MLLEPVSAEMPSGGVPETKWLGSIRTRLQRRIQPSERRKRDHYIIDLFSLEGEKCSSVL
jgi:hypothetical protein